MAVKVFVRIGRDGRDLTEKERHIVDRQIGVIVQELDMEAARADPMTAEVAQATWESFERCFALAKLPCLFGEAVPNEYWGAKDPESLRSPWFVATTKIGRIKVGWRKRVIVVDWSDSTVKAEAENLFQARNTTKFGRTIHCDSYVDVGAVLETLRLRSDADEEASPR